MTDGDVATKMNYYDGDELLKSLLFEDSMTHLKRILDSFPCTFVSELITCTFAMICVDFILSHQLFDGNELSLFYFFNVVKYLDLQFTYLAMLLVIFEWSFSEEMYRNSEEFCIFLSFILFLAVLYFD